MTFVLNDGKFGGIAGAVEKDCRAAATAYEYVFDPPHSVRCCVCGGVLHNPIQTSCGERSCEECYKELLK